MTTTRRPNIILILSDDPARRAISACGVEINHTPNLDRQAQEGLRRSAGRTGGPR